MSEGIKVSKSEGDVVAIMTADTHFSLNKPLARAEENWLEYQAGMLRQLEQLQVKYQCPIYIAGDVMDRWDSTAALINMLLAAMPKEVHAIPGNHDTPHHSYKEITKSAYWTLVEAGKIKNLTPGGSHEYGPVGGTSLEVHPYPCGFPARPASLNGLCLVVALIHDYIWTEKTGHVGADVDKRYAKWMPKLKGYDVAVFGDNHVPWTIQSDDKVSIFNCGAFIARKATEMKLKPSVGLLHASGKISRHYMDISKDKWDDKAHVIAKIESSFNVDLDGFVQELMTARNTGCDWAATVTEYCKKHKLDKGVADIMVRAVEKAK